ncbi:hypothetical protein Q9233_001077 [Columba guinea]|nr:hypothetical protein Q9233_001077 [Columba guinea]
MNSPQMMNETGNPQTMSPDIVAGGSRWSLPCSDRSSVRCQRGVADAGICVESTASGQPNFSPWKEKRHSAAGKHYWGSWPIRGHKIHHWPCDCVSSTALAIVEMVDGSSAKIAEQTLPLQNGHCKNLESKSSLE